MQTEKDIYTFSIPRPPLPDKSTIFYIVGGILVGKMIAKLIK
jgi:hypothetical protein